MKQNRAGGHPVADVLREQGRSQTWLSRRTTYSSQHINRVLRGHLPATDEFRQRCAEALQMSEGELFHVAAERERADTAVA